MTRRVLANAVVPALLAIGGSCLIVGALVAHDDLATVSKKTTCRTAGAQCVRPVEQISIEETPSDTVLGAVVAAGAALALAGAFYPRIRRLTFPGGTGVEIGAAEEATAVAEAVAEKIREQISASSGSEQTDVIDLAARSAAAAALAQQEVARLRIVATQSPELAKPRLRAGDISRVQRGMPLSRETLAELASTAVEDVFEDPDLKAK